MLGTYIGLPLVFGHNKFDLFKFLAERLWSKVLGWKEKLLSSAGKEVLIKLILQGIPLYVMSCFKIPATLCKRLQNIITNFWWASKEGNTPLRWVK